MEKNFNIPFEEPRQNLSMHPHKFAMWLFIVSVTMLFAAFTSAYIVRQGQGNWIYFDLPVLFWINTVVLLASSGTMHWAVTSARKDNIKVLQTAMLITVGLGFAFLIGQAVAWKDLLEAGIFFGGRDVNPSGSFLYVITGVHAAHLVSGVIFLGLMAYWSFRFAVHSKNMTRLEMCATYWHFLDILWLYLFGFLILNN